MPVDLYYSPRDENAPLPTLAEVQSQLEAAGLQCTIEPDEGAPEMWWIVFEPLSDTTIYVALKNERLVFATVEASFNDDLEFSQKIDDVLENLGFSCAIQDE